MEDTKAAELALREAMAAAEKAASEAASQDKQMRTQQRQKEEKRAHVEDEPEGQLKHRGINPQTKDAPKKKKKRSDKVPKQNTTITKDQLVKSLLAILMLIIWGYCGSSWLQSVWHREWNSEGSHLPR